MTSRRCSENPLCALLTAPLFRNVFFLSSFSLFALLFILFLLACSASLKDGPAGNVTG